MRTRAGSIYLSRGGPFVAARRLELDVAAEELAARKPAVVRYAATTRVWEPLHIDHF